MNYLLLASSIGAAISALPLLLIPIRIRTGMSRYIPLYLFQFLFYASIIVYIMHPTEYFLITVYIFQMLFFLNMYRAYIQKELFMGLSMLTVLVNALAVLFTFYFITFNLFELVKDIKHRKKTSPLVLSSTALFEAGVIIQILGIVFNHTYLSIWFIAFFVAGTLLFIIPGLRVAYEKEEI
ncbi:hypothetical protein AciM339_0911 [Aciduliprofundum sp. MAR08-339]|uniref:hypothetical protein n=1 Tax=Aciduliprofundum sp. (strain MAR08-339) TaxID=673860 RepID=UPI0002A48368|nr:hypothetical protein AciM339_0911 [Aciduliprofundum sp. MAR08-339]